MGSSSRCVSTSPPIAVQWDLKADCGYDHGQMFGVTGAGLTAVKYLSNDGKKARWNRDLWDRVSLDLFFFLLPIAIGIADWLIW